MWISRLAESRLSPNFGAIRLDLGGFHWIPLDFVDLKWIPVDLDCFVFGMCVETTRWGCWNVEEC